MSYLKKVWDVLNGKKTYAGAFLFTVYMIAVNNGWVGYDQQVVNVLEVVFGIGLAHKATKFVKNTL